jgi:hypothetical protein
LNDLVNQKLGAWLNGPPGAQGGRGKHVFQLSAELIVGTTPLIPVKNGGSADTSSADNQEVADFSGGTAEPPEFGLSVSCFSASAIPVVGTTRANPEENEGSADNSNADRAAIDIVNDLLAEAAAESQGGDGWTY